MLIRKILGISAFYYDAAAAIVIGGKIIAAAQEERFTRQKHTASFPLNAINYCLEETGLTIDELEAVVLYDKPLLKFERLLQTYFAFAPRGLMSFLTAIPVWLRKKMFFKKLIYDELREAGSYQKKTLNLLLHVILGMMPVNRDNYKTVLVILVGFVAIFFFFGQDWALKLGALVGLVSVFSSSAACGISWLWMKLAWMLSKIIPNVVLSLVFFLFLTPLAFLSKVFGDRNPLLLKDRGSSIFNRADNKFTDSYFYKVW